MRTLRAASLAAVMVLALAACGGSEGGTSHLPPFDVAALAGDWGFANAGDTLALTLAVADTTLTGSGYATNAQLRAMSGGTVSRIPLTVTGWASPSRYHMHLDAASPSFPGMTGMLEATLADPLHMRATMSLRFGGSTLWSESVIMPLNKH